MAQKLTVNIVGDDRSLQSALRRSTTGVSRFGDAAIANAAKQSAALRSVTKAEDSLLKVRARRAASVGPLRLAGIGLGAGATLFAAAQGIRAISTALETTGAAAFTATGRMKNFTSSLLTGDLIGGLNALTRVPKTLDEAGISATEAATGYAAFKAVISSGFEGPLRGIAEQAVHLVDAVKAQEAANNALADSLARLGTAFRDSAGQAVTFKGAVDDLGGLRGPGLVKQINTNLDALRFPKFTQAPKALGPTAENLAAQTIAQASGNLNELLRLQVVERDRLQKAMDNATGNRDQRIALNQRLAEAKGAVIGTQRQISDNAAAQARADAAAAKAAAAAARAAAARAKAAREEAARRAQQLRAARLLAGQQRQFRALGLTAGGETLTPTIANLRRQLGTLSERIVGTTVDTPKVRGQLARIEKVLTDPIHKATEATRKAIQEMFAAIRDQFDKGSKGPLTKTQALSPDRIISGLGLDPQTAKALRARLSGFNTAGVAISRPSGTTAFGQVLSPVVVNVTTTLDGAVVAQNTTKHQQTKARRNPWQKRGPWTV